MPLAHAARHRSVFFLKETKTTAVQQSSILLQGGKQYNTHPLLPIRGRDAAQGLTTVAKVDETKLSDRPELENIGKKRQEEPLRKHNRIVVFFGF